MAISFYNDRGRTQLRLERSRESASFALLVKASNLYYVSVINEVSSTSLKLLTHSAINASAGRGRGEECEDYVSNTSMSGESAVPAHTRAQSVVHPLELLAWCKVITLCVDALVVVDIVLEAMKADGYDEHMAFFDVNPVLNPGETGCALRTSSCSGWCWGTGLCTRTHKPSASGPSVLMRLRSDRMSLPSKPTVWNTNLLERMRCSHLEPSTNAFIDDRKSLLYSLSFLL